MKIHAITLHLNTFFIVVVCRSDFAIIQGDMVKKQKMIEDNRVNKNKCTGENFNKITGMKLCTQFQFANASMRRDAPYFPFTGPVMMQVELINQDVPDGYMMRMHMNEVNSFKTIYEKYSVIEK